MPSPKLQVLPLPPLPGPARAFAVRLFSRLSPSSSSTEAADLPSYSPKANQEAGFAAAVRRTYSPSGSYRDKDEQRLVRSTSWFGSILGYRRSRRLRESRLVRLIVFLGFLFTLHHLYGSSPLIKTKPSFIDKDLPTLRNTLGSTLSRIAIRRRDTDVPAQVPLQAPPPPPPPPPPSRPHVRSPPAAVAPVAVARTAVVAEDDSFVRALEERLSRPAPLPPYQFLIGTMEHNEAEDILEWLLYHLWLGVDHFIVYDHFSSGPLATKPILQPFIDLGWVTYVPYNVASSQAQTAAFETFISSFALLSKWLLFADPDEFLVRNTSSSSPQEEEEEEPFVEWFDRQYSHHGGVALPRLAFSSNGHYTRPNTTGLLSSYTETRALDANALIPKIVAQTRYKRDVKGDNIHKMSFQKGRELVDPRGREWGEVVRGVKEKSEVVSGGWEIYMHHYWAKSWEECMGKVKQQAFPGSWRERMGDRFCRQEMKSTEPYNEVEHLQDLTLARYGHSLQVAAERFKRRYPAYQPDDYTLSVLDSFAPVQHVALGPESVLHPGATLVIRNTRGSVGFLEVILSSQDTRVFLPVTYLPSGDASFSLPSSPITASAVPLVYGDLTITLTHPSFPSPTDDPLNTCTTIGHLRERLTPVQLRNVYDETCSFDRPLAGWRMATLTWPRSRYLGTTLFRRFFRISTTPHSAASSLGIEPPPPFAATLPIALSSLTHHGHWQRFPLWSHPPSTPPAHTSSLPRLYTTGRCPARFDKHYWVMQRGCPDDTTLSGQGGVLRWVPEGATSYAEAALTKEELRKCLHTGGAGGGGRKSRPKRIKLVGEKSTSHLFMAAQCLLDQALPDAHPAAATQHLQFSLIHHQAFSLAGLVPPLSRSDWLDLIAWDRTDDPDAPSDAENDTEEGLIAYPDVVVLSFAHRPTSWGSAASYERGLRSNLEGLIALLSSLPPSSPSSPPPPAPKLLWRDSPAVFASPSPFDSLIPSSNPTLTPSSPAPSPSDPGPSYLNSPRLELFNRLANGVVDQLGIERFENWEMTAARRDAAFGGDAGGGAGLCETVVGELAEGLMFGLCKGGVL